MRDLNMRIYELEGEVREINGEAICPNQSFKTKLAQKRIGGQNSNKKEN